MFTFKNIVLQSSARTQPFASIWDEDFETEWIGVRSGFYSSTSIHFFVVSRLSGVAVNGIGENENLETRRVARQLEQSHDADDAEELEDVVVLLQIVEQEVEIEAERRDKVDDVDRG